MLKKTILIFIIINAYSQNYAQIEKLPQLEHINFNSSIFKSNPIAILWGPIPFTAEYRLIIEQKLAKKQSILLGVSYLGKSMLLSLSEALDSNYQYQSKTQVNGFRVQAEYRFYFKTKNNENWGYYLAPHFSYSKAQFTDIYSGLQGYATVFRYLDYGIIGGNQKVIYNSAFDIWMGLGYKKNWAYWLEPNKIKQIEDFESILPKIKIYFGFNFGIAR